ncbi:MAG TPA: hypothetical protein VNO21_07075, partial [Polyangiaceae bacterium]|nr:hypothetical protein [Polyangiaceae bacterium]
MRYGYLFVGLAAANAAALFLFYGCDLQSAGAGGPGVDGSPIDAPIDTGGPVCPDGGTCVDGGPSSCEANRDAAACQPVVIANIPGATELALDGTQGVVVVQSVSAGKGAVYYVPLLADESVGIQADAAVPIVTVESKLLGPFVQDGTIYVAAYDVAQILRFPKDSRTRTIAVAGQSQPESIFVSGDDIYLLRYNDGHVVRAPPDGGKDFALPKDVGINGRSLVGDQ